MGNTQADMAGKMMIVCVLLVSWTTISLSVRPPTMRYQGSDERDNTLNTRHGLIRYSHGNAFRNKKAVGSPEAPKTFELSLSDKTLPMGLPWDMMMYNPMLRGKKSTANEGTNWGYGCVKGSRSRYCNINMIYKDMNNQLFKI